MKLEELKNNYQLGKKAMLSFIIIMSMQLEMVKQLFLLICISMIMQWA